MTHGSQYGWVDPPVNLRVKNFFFKKIYIYININRGIRNFTSPNYDLIENLNGRE